MQDLHNRVSDLTLPDILPDYRHQPYIDKIRKLGVVLDDDLKPWAYFVAISQNRCYELQDKIKEERDRDAKALLVIEQEQANQDATTSARIMKHVISARYPQLLGVEEVGVVDGYELVTFDRDALKSNITISTSVAVKFT